MPGHGLSGCVCRMAPTGDSVPTPLIARGFLVHVPQRLSDLNDMSAFWRKHPIVKWTVVSVIGLLAAVFIAASVADWNALRRPIARIVSAKTGHATSIDGNLSVRPWSWNPTVTVEDLNIQNPSWADRDRMLSVPKAVVQISLGHLLTGKLVLRRVEVWGPALDLERDASGRANWEAPSGSPRPAGASPHLPAIQRLVIRDGKIHVVDRVRKLNFSGTLAADEQAHARDESAFLLRCAGSLNGRAFKLQANGGPLINVDPDTPYHFTLHMTAADISLAMHATIPKPFDLAAYDAAFTLSGDDLADAYYLTDLALPNTSRYKIDGTLKHRGDQFQVDDFHGLVGSSDIAGNVSVGIREKGPKLTAQLTSTHLNLADLAPALGSRVRPRGTQNVAERTPVRPADTEPQSDGLLLPDADLQVNRVRGMDADVTFKAQSVISSKIPLRHVQFHLLLDNGVLRLDPLSLTLPQGRLAGRVQVDASKDVPQSDIDMNLENVDLAQFKPASATDPPMEGMLAGRVKLHGSGSSVHKFASSADGIVGMVIPHGQIRALFVELTGINVARALGLALTKNQQQVELRCGVANFQVEQGQLNAKTMLLDTTNMLITGHGDINLASERLDLSLQGDPKKLRLLRVRSPIRVGGTLSKPQVGIKPEKALLQAGTGTVLATLLTPIAAVLAFVDPGLAKDANCSTLVAQADAPNRPQ
jgi:uncharacterized protein involved in outer membrane biogenesis